MGQCWNVYVDRRTRRADVEMFMLRGLDWSTLKCLRWQEDQPGQCWNVYVDRRTRWADVDPTLEVFQSQHGESSEKHGGAHEFSTALGHHQLNWTLLARALQVLGAGFNSSLVLAGKLHKQLVFRMKQITDSSSFDSNMSFGRLKSQKRTEVLWLHLGPFTAWAGSALGLAQARCGVVRLRLLSEPDSFDFYITDPNAPSARRPDRNSVFQTADDIRWNASRAQPYYEAETSVARFHPRMARHKYAIPH